MNQVAGTYAWHRPMDVATSVFSEFVDEATAVIGAENADLLKTVDEALNSGEEMPDVLALDEARAMAGAESWGAKTADGEGRAAGRLQYLGHLAFLHEIAYRRAYGPAMFERKAGVTPCPDFLPANSHQVPASRYARYRRLNKVWNWALVLVVNFAFPLCIMPLFKSLMAKGSLGMRLYPFILLLWSLALAVAIGGFLACRSMRGRRAQVRA